MCEHFRVLPTDERFQALSDLQVDVLFSHWLHRIPEEEMWKGYWKRKSEQVPLPDEGQLRELGYDEEQIEAVLKELRR